MTRIAKWTVISILIILSFALILYGAAIDDLEIVKAGLAVGLPPAIALSVAAY